MTNIFLSPIHFLYFLIVQSHFSLERVLNLNFRQSSYLDISKVMKEQKLVSEQRFGSTQQLDGERVKYPTIDVYTSPRVYQQKIDHRSRPLCVYNGPIQSNNLTEYHDQPRPQLKYLRKIDIADGLLWQLQQMNERIVETNGQRQRLGIKILICVCMYNESKNAINLTLSGIYNNLELLQKQGFSSEQIGVVIIQDGILKLVNDRVNRTYAKGKNSMVEFYRQLDKIDKKPRCELEHRINTILQEMDHFNQKGLGEQVKMNNDFPPTIEKNISLLYQNLWHPSFTDEEAKLRQELIPEEERKPRKYLKLFSCFKHLNGTKLSSHLWFFEGFCRYLNPQYIVLLDVGTQPDKDGIVNLIRGFRKRNGDDDERVGGVTGLMSVDSSFPSEEGGDHYEEEPGWIRRTFFSIERAQEYEYIISHFIDKNAESTLGFLHVLPGAWSAYRYRALIKSDDYEPNLLEHSYFKVTLNPDMALSGYEQKNMYLAQDRILSLGIYCQPHEKYYLKYVPNAGARTDPMKTHTDLMKQRRRWINSSLFAFLYVFKNYYFNVSESSHWWFDKYILLNLSMFMALLSFVTSYLTPSLYFFVLYSTIRQIDLNNEIVQYIARVAALAFILLYLIAIAGGLTGAVWTKYASVVSKWFSLFTFIMLGTVSYNIIVVFRDLQNNGVAITNFTQMSILVMIAINLGGYMLILLLHAFTHLDKVGTLLMNTPSYWFYQGAYAQTMVVHAFCNVDDVSWGTKGSEGSHGEEGYTNKKVFFVSGWIFWNGILAYLLVYIDIVACQSNSCPSVTSGGGSSGIGLVLIAFYGTGQILIKLLLAMMHQLSWMFCNCCQGKMQESRKQKVERLWSQLRQEYGRVEEEAVHHMRHSMIVRKSKPKKN